MGVSNMDKEIQEYIDMKIDAALEEIRKEIGELKSSKANKKESINAKELMSLIKNGR